MVDKRVTDALTVVKGAVASLEAAIKAADIPAASLQPPKLVKPPMLLLGAGKPPSTDGGGGGTSLPVLPAGADESSVWLSSYINVGVDRFGISAWEVPKHTSKRSANAGSYSINRYCAYNNNNYFTELTYLADGRASYSDFRAWVDHHKAKGAVCIFQVYINSHGSATSFSNAQWANIVTKLNEFLVQANGDVPYVVLANEPIFGGLAGDNPGEATSAGWPSRNGPLYAQYARIVKQTILQSAWPNIKVIGPESMSLDTFRLNNAIAGMECSAAGYDCGLGTGAGTKMKDFIDIFGWHAYHYTGGTFAPSDGGYSLIQAAKTALAGIGFTGPIWQTEFMRTYSGNYNDSWANIIEQIGRRHAAEFASGVAHSSNFEWGSYGPSSHFDENSAAGDRARAWWTAYVNWWGAKPIGRIAHLTDGRIRVTRSDSTTLMIPTQLTDGTLAPNP